MRGGMGLSTARKLVIIYMLGWEWNNSSTKIVSYLSSLTVRIFNKLVRNKRNDKKNNNEITTTLKKKNILVENWHFTSRDACWCKIFDHPVFTLDKGGNLADSKSWDFFAPKTIALWARTTKNTDWSTGPLARPFARSLAPLTRGIVIY